MCHLNAILPPVYASATISAFRLLRPCHAGTFPGSFAFPYELSASKESDLIRLEYDHHCHANKDGAYGNKQDSRTH